MISVSGPSRLHFGLFALPAGDMATADSWPDQDGRQTLPARAFGGVGLMVERPGLTVSVEPADSWQAEGPLAGRALALAQNAAAALALRRPMRLAVSGAPREHVGLGVGTQLGLAVARAVAQMDGRSDLSAVELARLVGPDGVRRSASTVSIGGASSLKEASGRPTALRR
jgi:beta-ribofuranosylaminobenzene 5'-phosphate synthase